MAFAKTYAVYMSILEKVFDGDWTVQRRLRLARVNSKASLDKTEAIDQILAAGNSSRSVFQTPCWQFDECSSADTQSKPVMLILTACPPVILQSSPATHSKLMQRTDMRCICNAVVSSNIVSQRHHKVSVCGCSSSCTVCCDDYESGDALRVLTCGHKYHVECIDKWLLSSIDYLRTPACPICNAVLLEERC